MQRVNREVLLYLFLSYLGRDVSHRSSKSILPKTRYVESQIGVRIFSVKVLAYPKQAIQLPDTLQIQHSPLHCLHHHTNLKELSHLHLLDT